MKRKKSPTAVPTRKLAHRYRIYPDPDQAAYICEVIRCVRFVWNHLLHLTTSKILRDGIEGIWEPVGHTDRKTGTVRTIWTSRIDIDLPPAKIVRQRKPAKPGGRPKPKEGQGTWWEYLSRVLTALPDQTTWQRDASGRLAEVPNNWLRNVSNQALRAALAHLQDAFDGKKGWRARSYLFRGHEAKPFWTRSFFMRRRAHPELEPRLEDEASYPRRKFDDEEGTFSQQQNTERTSNKLVVDRAPMKHRAGSALLTIPKLSDRGLGPFPVLLHRPLPDQAEIGTVTIERTPAGDYYCSLCLDTAIPIPESVEVTRENTTGIMLTSVGAHLSDSTEHIRPQAMRHRESLLEERIKVLSARLSKKRDNPGWRQSNRYRKLRRRIAMLHEHLSSIRNDWQHKVTRRIVDTHVHLAVSDADYRRQQRIVGDRVLAVSPGAFRQKLTYKAAWKGSQVIEGRADDSITPRDLKESALGLTSEARP